MPRTTLLGTTRASHVSAPDDASISIVRPIAIPAPYRISGAVRWAMTMAAMALRGWTGIGIRYARPVRICMAPNMMSTLAPSRWDARATPIMSGTSVPMSPNAPDSSLRSKRIAGRVPAGGGSVQKAKLPDAPSRRDEPGEPPELRCDRARRSRFHGAVPAKDFLSQFRDARPASAVTAGERLDERLTERRVHRLDQQPGAPVGHPHLPRRGRNRAGTVDGGEQIGLAGADGDRRTAQNTDFREQRRSHGDWDQRRLRGSDRVSIVHP